MSNLQPKNHGGRILISDDWDEDSEISDDNAFIDKESDDFDGFGLDAESGAEDDF